MEAIGSFIPLILIFVIMYFLMIRPQQQQRKQHQAMIEALRRGDQVVTSGGFIGKITKVKDEDEVEVELADGVRCAWCATPSPRWSARPNRPTPDPLTGKRDDAQYPPLEPDRDLGPRRPRACLRDAQPLLPARRAPQ